MKIFKIAQESVEYMIEKGILYDENGDDVFSIKELLRLNIPLFKSPQQANIFLVELEGKTGRKYGRVPEKDYLHDLSYKDTKEEMQIEERKYIDERSEKLKRGQW